MPTEAEAQPCRLCFHPRLGHLDFHANRGQRHLCVAPGCPCTRFEEPLAKNP